MFCKVVIPVCCNVTCISSLTEQSLTFLMVPEHIMRHAPNAPSYVTLPVY